MLMSRNQTQCLLIISLQTLSTTICLMASIQLTIIFKGYFILQSTVIAVPLKFITYFKN